jgi:hypothetical protein
MKMSVQKPSRQHILDEIQRIAASSPGAPLGIVRFTKESGIKRGVWEGVHWTKWSDALREAGVSPNTLNQPYPEDNLLHKLAHLTRDLGRIPAKNDLKFAWNNSADFPAPNTFYTRYGSRGGMVEALRRWTTVRPEYSDVAALLPASTVARQTSATAHNPDRLPVVSDSYVPPVIASLPSLARMESAQPIAFEQRVAVAFEILGLEVEHLGQGTGREPDGIAKCREHGWAIIYDAKARAGVYRILASEERKFREYIEKHAHDLRRDGMGRFYFALISSAFSEGDLPKARELCRVTDAKAVALLEASALVKMVEQHVSSPLSFAHHHLERAFSETRIVGPTDIGDGRALEPVHTDAVEIAAVASDDGDGSSGMFATLLSRWPDFEAKVKTFAEFFDYSLIYCLATPLQRNDGLDITKPEDAALNGKREATLAGLGLLNHLAHDIVRDMRQRPGSIEGARSIVGRFRTLLAGLAILSVESLYETLGPRAREPAEFTNRMERLRAFKNDYESFARVANQHLGVEFFRQYVP